MLPINIENLKKSLKYNIFFSKKHYIFLLFTVNVILNMEKYLKKKNQLEYH